MNKIKENVVFTICITILVGILIACLEIIHTFIPDRRHVYALKYCGIYAPVFDNYDKNAHIICDNGADMLGKTADITDSSLHRLPDGIIKAFYNDGGVILITTGDQLGYVGDRMNYLFTASDDYSIDGTFLHDPDYNVRIIYLNNDSPNTERTLYHEIGHYIDDKCDFVNSTDGWDIIYKEEKENYPYLSEYEKSAPDEYFAQAYSEYIRWPEELKLYCPKTYEMLKKYEKTVCGI